MKNANLSRFRVILDHYLPFINTNYDENIRKGKTIRLPVVPIDLLRDLLNELQLIFEYEPNILSVPDNTIIVGDLHGHIFDLFRILRQFKLPPLKNYLFLGDYVDRGEFSTETVILLFTLKVLYPKNVFLIRGNHEFIEIFSNLGFYSELMLLYGQDDIAQLFNRTFSYMPLAALIDKFAVGIHGGLGDCFTKLSQLSSIRRPINEFDNDVLSELFWSDPDPNICGTQPSPRGMGCIFGPDITKNFLEESKIEYIIRGHQCIDTGVEKCENHKLYTVFSASRYCNHIRNLSGILLVRRKTFETHTYPPLPYIYREEVQFVPLNDKKGSLEIQDFPTKKQNTLNLFVQEAQSTPLFNFHFDEKTEEKECEPRPPLPAKPRSSRRNRLFEMSCSRFILKSKESSNSEKNIHSVKEPERMCPPSPRRAKRMKC